MGKSFSKILDVHEAQARCTAEEWERFSNGFDRISKDGKLDEASFRIEVLPGGIPKQLALRIFEVFDYKSRGHLKKNEFLCGMTILSHGTPDERIKFLFYIYDIENTGFLSKEILYRIAAVLQESESSSESSLELINTLFEDIGETQAINFQQFKSWAHSNISSVLIYWIWEICPRYPTANSSECIGWDDLLNRDDGSSKINLEESSSQSKSIWFARRSSIASLTHFNEQEITDIEKYYLKISSKFSIIDRENFKYLFNELTSLPEELCIKLFDAFDLDRDGNMDVKEFIVGLSTACRGTDSEKLFFCFTVFDSNGDDKLSREEMYSLLSSIWNIGKIHDRLQLNLCEQESDDCKDESLTSIDSVQEDEIKRIVDIAFKTYDSDNDLLLDFKDFRSFMLDNPSALDFLAHIRQFLNLQLGFAPLRSSEERQLILDIKRSSCMSLGDTYYVLCGKWWRGWSNYVRIDPEFLKELDSKSYSEKIGVIDLVEVKIEEEPLKPGRIDNSLLLKHGTSELNENLIEGDDFVVVDEEIWIAFLNWYGGGPEIPRQVIHAGVEPSPTLLVELYPYDFRIIVNERNNIISSCCVSRCSSIEFLIDKILAEQSMNKENLLVYNLFDENNPVLLNDWSMTLEDARLVKGQLLMFCDQPDHLNAGTVLELDSDLKRLNFESTGSSGVVGLYNLGNTCFMNSAIQCLSLTPLLTQYFLSDFYVKELNRENPLGMKGEVALAYGKLVKQMWMSNQFEVIYPRNLKWIIGKFAPQFLGFQQHDAQEFMQFLLDGLHEGLNRVITKPYTLIEDSNGRPDQEVASEHWDVHIQRNQSVIVDLFMGQLKSSLKWSCGRENVKFDPYSVLSLPLPLPEKRFLEVTIIPQESLRSPTKFSVQVKPHTSLWSLREQLASLCEIPSERLYLVEVYNNVVFSILNLNGSTDAIRTSDNVYGYEIPVVNNFDKTIVKPVTLDRKLLIGEKIDCLNGKNKWYKAKVMAVKGNRILVNFLGLPSKWDEWVPMNSSRIAPFESKTSLPPSDHLLHHARFENVLLPSNWICIHLCHRVLVSQKDYFINPVVPRLFGIPILLFIPPQSISYVQLYELVWDKVRRFAPTPVIRQSINVFHADDSALPPFVLSRVKRGGAYCSECSWTKMCLGHRVPFSSEQIDFHHNQTISIDWNILFYEKYLLLDEVNNILEHPSVAEHKELSQRKLHISDCMTLFTEIEELSGDSAPYCSSCKEMHLAQKSIELWSTPPIFIIHLKRLIHGSKLSSVVDFPIRDFDPSSFLVRDAKERSHCDKYDLYAVINHMGHSGAGHYVSYGFIPSENSWYCFDDDNVKKIDKTEVVSRHAYILCYAKKGLKIDDVLSAELRLKLNASLSVDEAALLDEKIEDGKGTWGMLRSWNTSVFKKFRPHQSRSKSPSQDSENITSTDSRECNMM